MYYVRSIEIVVWAIAIALATGMGMVTAHSVCAKSTIPLLLLTRDVARW